MEGRWGDRQHSGRVAGELMPKCQAPVKSQHLSPSETKISKDVGLFTDICHNRINYSVVNIQAQSSQSRLLSGTGNFF